MITNQKIFFDGIDHKIFLSNKFRKFRNSIRTFQKWTFVNVQKWILDFQVGVKIRKNILSRTRTMKQWISLSMLFKYIILFLQRNRFLFCYIFVTKPGAFFVDDTVEIR